MHAVKSSYTFKDLKKYYFSLLAVQGLSWVALAGVVWLGVTALLHYVRLPSLLVHLVSALAGLWLTVGWAVLVVFVLLLSLAFYFRGLHPSLLTYLFRSFPATFEFHSWLQAGTVVTSEESGEKVQSTKALEGFITFLGGGVVLVAVFVPKGVGGKAAAEAATDSIKEYADSSLFGLRSGSVQRTAGARYWIYRGAGTKCLRD